MKKTPPQVGVGSPLRQAWAGCHGTPHLDCALGPDSVRKCYCCHSGIETGRRCMQQVRAWTIFMHIEAEVEPLGVQVSDLPSL